MPRGRFRLEFTLSPKKYCARKRLVGYVDPEIKMLVKEDKRQHAVKESEIIAKAIDEYYCRRPELVKMLKSKMGRNYF